VIEIEDIPLLDDPIMIAAFEGWNDAGEVASSTIAHLIEVWDAELVAAIDPAEYYDFQVNRPRVIGEPGSRQVEWPTTRIYLARDTPLDRDVLLVHGIEPSFRWLQFTSELLSLAVETDTTMIITLGGLLADVPHTRPLPVTVTAENPDIQQRYDVEPSRYEGPTGIVGVLTDTASRTGIAGLSGWAAIPHYAASAPSPKATLAMVAKLEELLDAVIEHGDLAEAAAAWQRGVDDLAANDDEVGEYVQALEQAQDTTELPEASGDAIAREFEKYLRRRDEDQ
jgi:proteasome assembly chaperone (PAC2) family protein